MNGIFNSEEEGFVYSQFERIDRYRRFCEKTFEGDGFFKATYKLAASGIPNDYIQKIFEGECDQLVARLIDPLDPSKTVTTNDLGKEYLTPFVVDYLGKGEAYKGGHSFFFFGPNSSGKTFCANWLLTFVIQSGQRGYYIMFDDLYQEYRNQLVNGGDSRVINYVRDCDFLVLDELGKDKPSESMLIYLEKLLKYRSSNNLSTVICSNIDIRDRTSRAPTGDYKTGNDFLDRYGNSCYQILIEKYHLFQFSNSKNFREQRRVEWSFK